ncbi:CpaB family protein [Acidimangrovimonas sediminis]|uniref:hypothetical protein n=1 Tax=Acidimangrovimonas sediminis TaxID=2056283 RepID=UPI000C80100B|nr:hypothetical protein [Acidimangrovimonas sediminis]
MIAVGILMILASGAGTFYVIRKSEAHAEAVQHRLDILGERISVAVPARKIDPGARVAADAFTTLRLPRTMLPAGMLHQLPPLPKTPGATYVALVPLKKGQLLLPSDIGIDKAGPETGTMATASPDAIGIYPANLAQIGHLLTAGSIVDVFWQRAIGGGSVETRLLGQGLRVASLPATDGKGASGTTGDKTAAGGARAPLIVQTDSRIVARLLQAAVSGKLFVARAQPLEHSADGEVVVSEAELNDLPMIHQAHAVAAPTTAAPTTAVSQTVKDALTPGAVGLCTLSVVRSNATTQLKVPCR